MWGSVRSPVGVMNKPKEVLLWMKTRSTLGILNVNGETAEFQDAPHFHQHCPYCESMTSNPCHSPLTLTAVLSLIRAGHLVPNALRIHRKGGNDCQRKAWEAKDEEYV